MKRIVIIIICCVIVPDSSAKVISFDSRVAFSCSQCGASLLYQEMLLSQILSADKEDVVYVCDACRVQGGKGKTETQAQKALVVASNYEYETPFPDVVINKADPLRIKVLKKNALAFLKKEQEKEDDLLKSFTLSLLVPLQQAISGGYRLSLLSSERLLLESDDGALFEIKSPDRTRSSRTGEPVSYFTISGIDAVGSNGKFLLFSKQARSKETPVDDEDVKTVFELDAVAQIFTLVPKPKVSFIKNSSGIAITVEDYD